MGKGSSPPAPPDYRAAATEQGEANQAVIRDQTFANRANQTTPWGGVTWTPGTTVDPVSGETVGTWEQDQFLDPTMQGALQDQINSGATRSMLAGNLTGNLSDVYDSPVDYNSFREVTELGDPNTFRQRGEDAAYERATSRLDPMFEDEQNALAINLRNRGLRSGDEAYEAEMDRFGRRKTDAYQSAINESSAAGRAESALGFDQSAQRQAQSLGLRQNEIAEALQQRGMPLEEINMLLAGQGVQPPNAPGYSNAGQAQAANLFGAAQQQYGAAADAYNAQQAQRQSLLQGAVGIGTGLMGMFSDRRLKTNIRREGVTPGGTPVYTWNYVWGGPRYRGVMADEVPEAAVLHSSGYLMVDYGKVR